MQFFSIGKTMMAVAAIALLNAVDTPVKAQHSPIHYRVINYPGAKSWTSVRAINRRGEFVGFFNDNDGKLHGYISKNERTLHFTRLDYPGAAQTLVLGINNRGVVVGTYSDGEGTQHGFVRFPASLPRREPRWISIDAPDAVADPTMFYEFGSRLKTSAFSINDNGDIVGQYADAEGIGHGFMLREGRYRAVDVPNAFDAPGGDGGTMATHINNRSEIAGAFGGTMPDNSLIRLGFVKSAGRYTPLAPAGSIYTQAYAISDNGIVGGAYADPNYIMHGFLLSRGHFTTIDAPGANGVTFIYDVDTNANFVGEYDTTEKTHGFIATR